MPPRPRASRLTSVTALVFAVCAVATGARADGEGNALPDVPVPIQTEFLPERPRPLLEWGPNFLGQGKVENGIRLPTGAVWQPALMVFGTYRGSLQSWDGGDVVHSEWANRLDLFGNLALSGTERILVGFRPLDRDGKFSGYDSQGGRERWLSEWNARLETLFFEGDLGEIFPGLDRRDRHPLDIGFAVGRQPLTFQDGLLLEDSADAVGITRNTLRPTGTANLRFTGAVAWSGVDRADGTDSTATLYGLFTEVDRRHATVNFDMVMVQSSRAGNSFHLGLSTIRRLGSTNAVFRVLGSFPFTRAATGATAGTLLMAELSKTPGTSHDLLYLNAFVGLERYTPAARDPRNGSLLSRVGILFAGSGVGGFGAALPGTVDQALGGVIGYQRQLDHGRRQVVVEAGAYHTWRDSATSARVIALGARFQQAVGRRFLLRVDGSGSWAESESLLLAARLELATKF